MLLEKNGVQIAAVSYDSKEILAAFAQKHSIGFPLLSDQGSETIRKFGIFNLNMAPDLRAYGVPHPVEYLVDSGRHRSEEILRAELPASGERIRGGAA